MHLDRRTFLKSTSAAIVVGVTPAGVPALATPSTSSEFNAFVRLADDGALTVLIGQAEIGQGTSTGLAMLVADEIGADWSQVDFEFATGRPEYWHPTVYQKEQITGGSVSIVAFEEPMRKAAAAVRDMLLAAAADRFGTSEDRLVAEDGIVREIDGRKRSIAFADLVSEASRQPVPPDPRLKTPDQQKLVGRPTKRLDAPAKVDGTAVFGFDVDVPDMAYAAVRQAPAFGADVETLDDSMAAGMPGVIAVHRIPNGFAVVAEQYWQALQALDAVDVVWSRGTATHRSSADVIAALTDALDDGEAIDVMNDGDAEGVFSNTPGADRIEATYTVPFLAHATMEPMNATVRVIDGAVELWVPTQAPTLDQIAVGKALGVEPGDVTIHMTYAGGGFGRRGFSEYAVQAALLSKAVGRPVKVLWTREEDTRQDYYRPAFAARMRGAVTDKGQVSALGITVAGPGIWQFNRPPLVEFFNGVDHLAIEGANDLRYGIRNVRVSHVMTEPNQRIGYWRSIGYSHNVYFVESFLDELAHANGIDPYDLRRDMLVDDSRSQKVLETAARQAGWFDARPANRHLGIAFFATERWQTRVAQVADVSLIDGLIRVNRIVCVADVGRAVNPLSVEAQLQGAVLYGLSAALYGQIDIEDGAVVQSAFSDYPVVTLADAPPVDVTIIEGAQTPGSVGEIGTPCAAPALTNAVFAATGQRIRSLPLRAHDLV